MKAQVWGCRGSIASPSTTTVGYGGNTSCVEVRLSDSTLIVLDAGTGIHNLGALLNSEMPEVVHLFLSHLHMDHLEGLAFFGPLWRPDAEIHIWGPASPTRTLVDRIARYMSPPLFPLDLRHQIPSRCEFHDVPQDEWKIGTARIFAERIEHPGDALGYRIEENGRVFAYIPDHEPALISDMSKVEWVPGYEIARGADVLLHDSQYTEDEYPNRKTWGHSSVADAVKFARISNVKQLVLFHHNPYRSDKELEGMLRRARELWGAGNPPVLAREGMVIELGDEVTIH